jgi:hypothetical protein
VKESKTLNAIQVRIDDNVRMLAELHARWEREDEMARNMKICTISTTSDVSNASKLPSFNGRVIGVEKIPTTFDDFDVDGCNISEVILFLQNLARSPHGSSMNVAFTKHITNALMQIREDKLKQKVSIPRKLEDGLEPIIEMNVNDFDCNALCDLGASISIMPRKFYDMLGLPPLENCYFDVPLADVAKKKPLGRINDVHIMVNNNLVPVDFLVFDI